MRLKRCCPARRGGSKFEHGFAVERVRGVVGQARVIVRSHLTQGGKHSSVQLVLPRRVNLTQYSDPCQVVPEGNSLAPCEQKPPADAFLSRFRLRLAHLGDQERFRWRTDHRHSFQYLPGLGRKTTGPLQDRVPYGRRQSFRAACHDFGCAKRIATCLSKRTIWVEIVSLGQMSNCLQRKRSQMHPPQRRRRCKIAQQAPHGVALSDLIVMEGNDGREQDRSYAPTQVAKYVDRLVPGSTHPYPQRDRAVVASKAVHRRRSTRVRKTVARRQRPGGGSLADPRFSTNENHVPTTSGRLPIQSAKLTEIGVSFD